MKTVLNVKTDKDIKDKAQALAKHLGIPLSVVVTTSLREFVESGEITIKREPQLKPAVAKRLAKSVEEARKGINTVGPFSSAEEMVKSLRS